jgi:hypothetical protein
VRCDEQPLPYFTSFVTGSAAIDETLSALAERTFSFDVLETEADRQPQLCKPHHPTTLSTSDHGESIPPHTDENFRWADRNPSPALAQRPTVQTGAGRRSW